MKKCDLTLEKLIAREVFCTVNTGNGTASGTVLFRVWGFHPLLRVMVYAYFQRKTGTFAGTHTWSASALKRDTAGQLATLQPIFTGRTMPDGHEVNSGAEGILYTALPGNMETSGVSGNWIAEVVAKPEHDMDNDLFCRLCEQLRLEVSPTVLVLSATIP